MISLVVDSKNLVTDSEQKKRSEQILLCLGSFFIRLEIDKLKEIVLEIDERAFVEEIRGFFLSPDIFLIPGSFFIRLEIDKLKEIVLEIDERAFVTIQSVHDIVGGRFKKSGH